MLAFCTQKGYTDREVSAIVWASQELDLGYICTEEPKHGLVPVGSVEYCLPLSSHPIDFFPIGFAKYFNRERYRSQQPHKLSYPSFVKDLSGWKTTFETKLYPAGFQVPLGNFLISEPINMVNEWRYYVADGDCITKGWYRGQDEDAIAPDIKFPKDFNGVADFADVDGALELIECHAPFACGWYGEDHIDYVYWQYWAWTNTQI